MSFNIHCNASVLFNISCRNWFDLLKTNHCYANVLVNHEYSTHLHSRIILTFVLSGWLMLLWVTRRQRINEIAYYTAHSYKVKNWANRSVCLQKRYRSYFVSVKFILFSFHFVLLLSYLLDYHMSQYWMDDENFGWGITMWISFWTVRSTSNNINEMKRILDGESPSGTS